MNTETSEMVIYWRGVIATLNERGLLKRRPQQGGTILPEADGYLLLDRAIFNLDMHRLGGIPRETWLDSNLWAQWQATLQGRRCFVSDGGGLAICIARQPGQHVKRLPKLIPLAVEHVPEQAYRVTLGHARRGPILLDLAGKHRAILVGGTSGGGKTNLMQAIILQLAAKHTPAEVQFAIVDTKEVDFGADYERLPHLFAPIAHDLAEAARLIGCVENERLRRQTVMAAAGVSDWRKADAVSADRPCLPAGRQNLPLLLLVVDEAADFAKTAAMKTLIEVARKGRAFGVSVIVGTQHPSAKVINAQVKANLPTAIAFQTRTHVESGVILGKSGAEQLSRPGLALTFVERRWETVQTLRVDEETVQVFIGEHVAVERPALSEIETALVRYAMEELGGAFIVNKLYEAHRGTISKRALETLAQRWEAQSWLTTPASRSAPRRVTDDLLTLLSPATAIRSDDTVTRVTRDDTTPKMMTRTILAGDTDDIER